MAFLKRLGFYLFGLAIGLIFLAVFFKKKSDETGVEFCYFPNCRTLKDIRSKPLTYSEEINTLLSSKKMDSTDIQEMLINGEVDFNKSDTKSEPCRIYFIASQKGFFEVKNCPEKAVLSSFTAKTDF